MRRVVGHKHHQSLLEIMDMAKWTEMKVSTNAITEELFRPAIWYRAFDFLITEC